MRDQWESPPLVAPGKLKKAVVQKVPIVDNEELDDEVMDDVEARVW